MLLRVWAWKTLQGWRMTAQLLWESWPYSEEGFSYIQCGPFISLYDCCLMSSHHVPLQGAWVPLPVDILTGIGRLLFRPPRPSIFPGRTKPGSSASALRAGASAINCLGGPLPLLQFTSAFFASQDTKLDVVF